MEASDALSCPVAPSLPGLPTAHGDLRRDAGRNGREEGGTLLADSSTSPAPRLYNYHTEPESVGVGW